MGALYWVGLILYAVGGIWLLVVAFKQSIAWGICSLLIPFVIIVFAIKYWQNAKTPFLIFIAGAVLWGIGFWNMYSSGAMTMPT